MPKTHLPGHLDSVRQTVRPKHQVLIAKCYPRLPKNSAADVKPNGSELSYLMYYASSRKSKLQKVGTFLERKTASDVSKSQSARVLVTLQILTALLDNKAVGEGSGLALMAPYVMRIIGGILENTNDVSLIQATQTTWNAFCKHPDQALLAAEHEHRELFEKTITQYSQYAHKSGAKKLGKGTTPVATHDAIRLRETGLQAIKSVLTSVVMCFESSQPVLYITIPAVLGNLHGDGASHIEHLLGASKRAEEGEKNRAMNPRQSIATVRTFTGQDDTSEPDPRAAEGTAQDADAIAEEEVAILALDCLKTVFASDNRAQARTATSVVLKYLSDLQYYRRPSSSDKHISDLSINTWATKIFELCTAWTPVGDRFILLVTAVETLVRLPLKERDIRQHLLHASLIDHILRSDLNLIGLSTMDVLLQLMQHTLRILQSGVAPPATASSNSASAPNTPKTPASGASQPASAAEQSRSNGDTDRPSPPTTELVDRLKSCIAGLATHIYYTDQISDMIGAILLRLKPNPTSSGQQAPSATVAAIEEPRTALSEVASNSGLPTSRSRSNSTNNGYFSFDAARQTALEAVRDIIKVANNCRHHSLSGLADSRNAVPIAIWEGTQWLLKDPSHEVRIAYVQALMTWLEFETDKTDTRLTEPEIYPKNRRQQKAEPTDDLDFDANLRAVTSASIKNHRLHNRSTGGGSQHQKSVNGRQTFLQLLHVANYDNALHYAASSDVDIILVHCLLAKLVQKLGINAATSGLPIIFKLQEDIARVESPIAKVRMGSLVHGYLWALVEVFGINTPGVADDVASAIMDEINRRKDMELWMEVISYPTKSLDGVAKRDFSGTSALSKISEESVAHNELKAFDDREGLVGALWDAYRRSMLSPPPSLPGSPGRAMSPRREGVERTNSSYVLAKKTPEGVLDPVDPNLSPKARRARKAREHKAKEQMMANWTREDAIREIQAMAPRSLSLSGQSRTSPQNGVAGQVPLGATSGNHRSLLATTNQSAKESDSESSTGVGAKRAPTIDDLRQVCAEPADFSGLLNGSRKEKVNVKALLASLATKDYEKERRFPKRGRPMD
ncbi:hypothetical protein KC351_g3807 [Hortaea werneckii]|nr:hypothetical protein KC351_g3807 [Hortaea werneckii]